MSDRLPPEIQADLETATELFGEAYALAKEAATESETHKWAFYEAADKALAAKRLPQKTITVTGEGDYTVMEFVEAYYPDWEILQLLTEDFPHKVLLQRKPSLMKFDFTHPGTKMTYQRTYTQGNTVLDVDRLQDEDPELWEAVSDWPPIPQWLQPFIGSLFGVKGEQVDLGVAWAVFCERNAEAFGLQRQMKPPNAWGNKEAGRLQQYMKPGKITVKIVPPRAATEEELAALEEDDES